MYVALEGIDTAGKSTQIAALKAHFSGARGVLFTFEPGNTPLGVRVREMLLGGGTLTSGDASSELHIKSARAQALLFLADRAEHFERVLKPNLSNLIISDRSCISGIAYAAGLDFAELLALNKFALQGVLPDKIILLKLTEAELKSRLSAKSLDAIERRGVGYLMELQERMLETISRMKINAAVIDASLNEAEITAQILSFIEA